MLSRNLSSSQYLFEASYPAVAAWSSSDKGPTRSYLKSLLAFSMSLSSLSIRSSSDFARSHDVLGINRLPAATAIPRSRSNNPVPINAPFRQPPFFGDDATEAVPPGAPAPAANRSAAPADA